MFVSTKLIEMPELVYFVELAPRIVGPSLDSHVRLAPHSITNLIVCQSRFDNMRMQSCLVIDSVTTRNASLEFLEVTKNY